MSLAQLPNNYYHCDKQQLVGCYYCIPLRKVMIVVLDFKKYVNPEKTLHYG